MTKERRTIRRVPLPSGRRGAEHASEEDAVLYEHEEFLQEEEQPTSFPRRKLMWGITIFFLIILAVVLALSASGATVMVTPRTQVLALNSEFTASGESKTKLQFELLPIHETEEALVVADTTKKVVERASGTIIIFNAFSDKSQRLIKNTRFETSSGLIYRIASSITVPGKTVRNGRAIPGSLEVAVTADSPGTDYNIPLADFTIPGFKADPARFAGFYARSKTPMTGGFDGIVKAPTERALQSTRASLQARLEKKVAKAIPALVPPTYILFNGAVATTYEPLAAEAHDKDTVTLRERAVGAAYIFKRDDIAKAIGSAALQNGNALPFVIPNLESLAFELKDVPTGNPAEVKNLRFTLKGSPTIVWSFDVEKLKSALLGKPKTELPAILAAFPTIEKADLILRPFWIHRFPKNPSKISVEKNPVAVKNARVSSD